MSSDYTNTDYNYNYTYEEPSQEPSHHLSVRERPHDSSAFWLETRASTEYNPCYCALCDKEFKSLKKRERHVARSFRHPYCEICDRRFLNGNALRAHIMYSFDHANKADDDCRAEDWEDTNNDMTWETYDDFDFDDLACIGDEVPECIAHLVQRNNDEEDQEEEQNESGPPATEFTCPICEHTPKTVCSTLCGHLFCAPCIKTALEISGSCPVCDKEGSVKQLRKMYISA